MPLPPGADVVFAPSSLDPVTLEFRLSWGIDARGGCYAVNAFTTDQAGRESVHVGLESSPECVPVPEPSVSLALILGVLWVGSASALGPVIGRMLKRNGERYPPPTQKRPEP